MSHEHDKPWMHLADDPPTPDAAVDDAAFDDAALEEQHTVGAFPHEKLDAYRVAVKMAALAHRIAERIPRGHRNVADHLQRAADNSVLLLAEGANRRGAALKRQRFSDSRGECGEVAAAADLLREHRIGVEAEAEELRVLAGRVSAMLTRLMARLA